MQMSKRLNAVADMVTSGCRLADIGTDHAYIPIALTASGRVPYAIAMDVNKGPLQKASENIVLYHLKDKIETRLSDGLAGLKKGEAESIIIAGMGGPLTVRILQEGKSKLGTCRELILQPQSDIPGVRRYLFLNGWDIIQEEMVEEDGKYYPMMKAVPGQADACSEIELRYGPHLLRKKHPVLMEFLVKEEQVHQKILDSLAGQNSETSTKRRREVAEEMEIIKNAIQTMNQDGR